MIRKTRVRKSRYIYTIESGDYELRFRSKDQRDVVYNFIVLETTKAFADGQRIGEQMITESVTDDFGEEVKVGGSV